MNYSSPSALLFREASNASLPSGLAPFQPSRQVDVVETAETVSYTREFAEILAERRVPKRVAPAYSSRDDVRHAPTLLAGVLACMLSAGTCGALWYAIAAGMVAPSGSRADGLVVERSLALAPLAFALVPISALMDLAQPADAPEAAESGNVSTSASTAALHPKGMSSEPVQRAAIDVASGQSIVLTGTATTAPAVSVPDDPLATLLGPLDVKIGAPIDDLLPPIRYEPGESGQAPLPRGSEPHLGAINTASSDDSPSSSGADDAQIGTGTKPAADESANAPATEDVAKSEDSAPKAEKAGKSKSNGDPKSEAENGKSANSGDQNGGKGQSGKSDGNKGKGGKDKAGKGDGGKDKGGKGKGG